LAVGRYHFSVSLDRIKKSTLLDTRTRPFSVTVPRDYLILSVIKSSRMRWARNVARTEDKRGAYQVLVGRPDRKRPLGRPRLRWKQNIKTDLQELGWKAWIVLIRLWIRIGGGHLGMR